ncbi:hypothetical protein Clacol_010569 [Clathrus columnatus]|uniref:Xylanolytic transcriptional activator regulatory domain-containing protein n=1 Tax=Clathrus columnatus TaxID=1419009 RepID=A0AAV5AUF1_9AGAM|nr:hypothetical protein Clacol_001865 [Clathrus columnatus]GJJ16273.1 hypothetical protein Clacol_010569 [Clathrus columnatus]
MGRNPSALSFAHAQSFARIIQNETSSSSLTSTFGAIPACLAQRYTGDGGMYAGPTSSATFLTSFVDEDNQNEMLSLLSDPRASPASSLVSGPRDHDILSLLPDFGLIDDLIDYYFVNSTWENRYLDYETFTAAWSRFKDRSSSNSNFFDDRLFLATLFLVLAVTVLYLPSRHELIAPLNAHPNDLAENYYNYSCTLLQRYRTERHIHSLEFIELLLLHTHYLLILKDRCEDIWSFRGELLSIATAMGLHRDPSMWKMPKEVAERRRWAWWNILLTDRWLSWMLGRPMGIINHHYDTCMPGPLDHVLDPTQRVHLPQVLIFRLVEILGEIQEHAMSIRPVSHEEIMAHDRRLQKWLETFPEELNFDDYHIAKSLASNVVSARRAGLQSLCMMMMYNNIRFTLHRPYAKSAKHASMSCGPDSGLTETQFEQSLEIAINSADRVIHLATQARHDFLANRLLVVPGHLNWGLIYMFNAAMFFVYQILADPEQPGANLFRGNVRRGIALAESLRGLPASQKVYSILAALAPVCDEVPDHNLSARQAEERENKKKRVLSFVKRLAFPCFDRPGYSPVVPPLPLTLNSTFSPFSSDSPGSSGIQLSSQNNNGNGSGNRHSNSNTRNEAYPQRSLTLSAERELLNSINSRGHPQTSYSPPEIRSPDNRQSTLHSHIKSPPLLALPPQTNASTINPSAPLLSYPIDGNGLQHTRPTSQSRGLYNSSTEHSQNHSNPNSAQSQAHTSSLLNPYLLNGTHSSSDGARVSGEENGELWGTTMEIDSSTWDGFLSVVPPSG